MTTALPFRPTAWIAGATGLTGSHLIHVLTQRGWTVHAHVRPDSSQLAAWQARFQDAGATPEPTPWEKTAITERLQALQPDVVFALLGTTKARARRGDSGAIADTYQAVDYGLTSLLLHATADAAPNARFVYLSAYGVKANSGNPYVQARAQIEQELADSALDYRIIRPAIIAGDREEKRALERIGGSIATGFSHTLRALGAKTTAANLRTRSGLELATNCADAAQWAAPRTALTGADLDALAAAHKP